MGLLDGKTAIVTGAARGIGKAIALKFAAEGANIAFTDLVIDENAENTAKEPQRLRTYRYIGKQCRYHSRRFDDAYERTAVGYGNQREPEICI